MDTVKVLGYRLIVRDLNVVPLDGKVLVNTISPNSFGLTLKDKEADEALRKSDYLVLDGLYFGLAPLLLKRKRIRRITGWDCFLHFSKKMNEINGRCFFMGSTPETLSTILEKFAEDYPNTTAAAYSPPFKQVFTEEDNKLIRQRINEFKPDVLFVGLTAPKQEKWAYQNIAGLDVHVVNGIGNVFDWYAGNTERPGRFWQLIGLEWLLRILYRPEIFRRNILNQLSFFWHLLLILLNFEKHD
jgi:N-acetylglucosaminyldiphosphoundecaprenol N-acetyl-beta-D-mannosaminyltransferase